MVKEEFSPLIRYQIAGESKKRDHSASHPEERNDIRVDTGTAPSTGAQQAACPEGYRAGGKCADRSLSVKGLSRSQLSEMYSQRNYGKLIVAKGKLEERGHSWKKEQRASDERGAGQVNYLKS